MDNPLASILIANYNNSNYFNDLFDSIFKQTYKNWEVIFVDDASNDNSLEEIKRFSSDKRIKVHINDKNYGIGYTKKRAADLANGEILLYVDPDDAITETALEDMVLENEKHPEASLIYSKHYVCDNNLEPLYINTDARELRKNKTNLEEDIISHLVAFKKRHYNLMEPLDPNLKTAVDKDLYFKLEEVGELIFIDKPLYYYRRHVNGISQSNKGWVTGTAFEVIKKAYERRKIKGNKKISLWTYLELKGKYKYYYSLFIGFEEKNNCWDYYKYLVESILLSPRHNTVNKVSLLFLFTPIYKPSKKMYKKIRQ